MRVAAWLVCPVVLAAGCAPATRVLLLPQATATGSVQVTAGASSAQLTRPYETAVAGTFGVNTEQADEASVRERYRQLLAVQPPEQLRFTLFFEIGGAQLTPSSRVKLGQVLDSTEELDTVLREARARPGSEIVITGHTDRVGRREANDALSLQRAQAVRTLLIERGFDPARIEAIGRGEREPLIDTADEVDEPRNRRVEITVR